MLRFKLINDNNTIKLVSFDLNSERNDLFKFFKRKSKKAAFNVLVDRGVWDGFDHFINKEGEISVSLWKEVYNFSNSHGYDCEIEGIDALLSLGLDRDKYLKYHYKSFVFN